MFGIGRERLFDLGTLCPPEWQLSVGGDVRVSAGLCAPLVLPAPAFAPARVGGGERGRCSESGGQSQPIEEHRSFDLRITDPLEVEREAPRQRFRWRRR